jgi:hypothetical protein
MSSGNGKNGEVTSRFRKGRADSGRICFTIKGIGIRKDIVRVSMKTVKLGKGQNDCSIITRPFTPERFKVVMLRRVHWREKSGRWKSKNASPKKHGNGVLLSRCDVWCRLPSKTL